ncbi:MAG: D-alanyl-D-alanine carboxypeptidase, partial [Lachnospiraceae bacterium]|nr:D-alanyl-D-alanine carboxypeptidase [Lachnospiraceae bacterium]
MAAELITHELYYEYSTVWLDEVVHESGRKTSLTNTNRLIRLYDGCDGVKTGSTNEAGYCMAATARRGDMRLIAVVLGADSGKERFNIAAEMMDYGFANYRRYPVTQAGAKVRGSLPVVGG